ncbi:hypothetical protein SAMN05660642_01314 [Geodermatophilus siccatus]|uniref:Uncharacterized protein n=1 Tax=Geodermatophilus siccatus TaxID=1137991 RepID=A0A1G9PRJ8_9ACTN|nr:hypothetical protein [Geodermatophilus siccatus]SDM00837.1 hypothetical protein SAMN05660642_01314 [Geodermatophilus siccatus]
MRRVLVGTAAAVMVLSGGVASAADAQPPGDDEGWVPVPEEFYEPVDVEACGSVVTVAGGDVREAEVRQQVLDDGSTFLEFRGSRTVDLTRQSDGATIDELDVWGRSWDLVSSDGSEVVAELDGPLVLWAGNDVERAAADEAGLPHLMYVQEGTILLRLTVDPATGESTAVDGLRLEADVVDLCGVLDEAAGD